MAIRLLGILPALAVLLVSSRPAAADEARPDPVEKTFKVRTVRDVAYYEGPDADPVKHKLDLFLPKDHEGFPVLFFVHGGAWAHGDKSFLGVYSSLGMLFARHGVGAVVINYRLSPGVQHPEHVKDVARAFAWTHRHIAEHGGRPDAMFVCGHSAGGHLVALLGTDERFLKAEGLTLQAIKGAVPISGVYVIPDSALLAKMAAERRPVKGQGGPGGRPLLRSDPFARAFGPDADLRKLASPVTHARKDCPPFLILYAENDFPTCDRMSEAFGKALREQGAAAEVRQIAKCNHLSIIFNAIVDDDPTARAVLRFIHAYTEPRQ
jgi:arylformamidase